MLTMKFRTMEGPSMHSAEIAMNISWYHQIMAEKNQACIHSDTPQTNLWYDYRKWFSITQLLVNTMILFE